MHNLSITYVRVIESSIKLTLGICTSLVVTYLKYQIKFAVFAEILLWKVNTRNRRASVPMSMIFLYMFCIL